MLLREFLKLVWQSSEGPMVKVPGRTEPYVLAQTGSFPSIAGQSIAVSAWEDDGVFAGGAWNSALAARVGELLGLTSASGSAILLKY